MNEYQNSIHKIIGSRGCSGADSLMPPRKIDGEGGCGVIGLASTKKVAGKHLLSALTQMRNRGNGKGGGIAVVGLTPQVFGVTQDILDHDYLLACAYLDLECRSDLEKLFIDATFDIDHVHEVPHMEDYRDIKDLEIEPPKVICYFVRVKQERIKAFRAEHQLFSLSDEKIADEVVYQNTYKLNETFYAASGEKKAFVLSHGKNLLVLKMVGYGDDVIRYYQLNDFEAYVWIGHHRYPTRGRVWHPGGAHPFVGLNEALVHNGDFANYFSLCEHLSQRNIRPLFLTDTEVAALTFDLLYRTYGYPLEYVIEALAPTTERDFTLLPAEKQALYQEIQKCHIHGSPDGPWFFLIAQSLLNNAAEQSRLYRLIGITDTSMLRPQVFAIQRGMESIGFAASEKQAIDAVLNSLSQDDPLFWPCADTYWNARGGSYTDGGAFIFTVDPGTTGKATLVCTDKFNQEAYAQGNNLFRNAPGHIQGTQPLQRTLQLPDLVGISSQDLFQWIKIRISSWDYETAEAFLETLYQHVKATQNFKLAVGVIASMVDQYYPVRKMRRSWLNALFHQCLQRCFGLLVTQSTSAYMLIHFGASIPFPQASGQTLVIDATNFPAEGNESLARTIIESYHNGFRSFILFNTRGQRFIANGLKAASYDVVIHVFGASGDYLASGIDGAKVIVHGSGQDALAQIMQEGTLVVYGDVGQTFMYGAKGGKAFVLGNAAGRPLINAVGNPKVVINGTCLDYLAESFMAGNPLDGGGYVIVNGIAFNEEGELVELGSPYPGNSLFALASGGAIYLRDPVRKISEDQLNGGQFSEMTARDWDLIHPTLAENEKLFDIPIARLLQFEGKTLEFHQVYRKITPSIGKALQEEGEAAWVKARD